MFKQILICLLLTFFLATGISAAAQQPNKVRRIGYLSNTNRGSDSARNDGVQAALRERGYVAGQNITIEYRYAEGRVDRAFEMAAELVRLEVDVIVVAGGAPWVNAVKNATTTIPIVMMSGGSDPVQEGLVESLARPGANVTGISLLNRELGGKRLELLKEAVPKLARVAVLYDPAIPSFVRDVKEVLPIAAKALGLTLQSWEIRAVDDFDQVFTALNKQRPDGLYFPPGGPLTFTDITRITEYVLKTRLPSMFITRSFVAAGGLMSYGADVEDGYKRVAYFIDRILKGARPADLPVEQPMKFEFVVNLKTAKQIGLTIDPNLLARATRIIR